MLYQAALILQVGFVIFMSVFYRGKNVIPKYINVIASEPKASLIHQFDRQGTEISTADAQFTVAHRACWIGTSLCCRLQASDAKWNMFLLPSSLVFIE